jgi:hypothetical protein
LKLGHMLCRRNHKAFGYLRSRCNYKQKIGNSGGRYWDRTIYLVFLALA